MAGQITDVICMDVDEIGSLACPLYCSSSLKSDHGVTTDSGMSPAVTVGSCGCDADGIAIVDRCVQFYLDIALLAADERRQIVGSLQRRLDDRNLSGSLLDPW